MKNLANQAEKLLKERGIYDAAAKAGWRPWEYKKTNPDTHAVEWGAGGWSYPIYNPETGKPYRSPKNNKPILRWKNLNKDEQGGEKYIWMYGQQKSPPYYILPGTREAIAQADGVCYIAAGEPDVLAYVSAGLPNTLAWLNGETNLPNDLVEVASKLGICHLIYLVDRDATGERSAALTHQALAGSSIQATIYRLPEYLGDKGDINDLWKWVGFDPVKFRQALETITNDPDALIPYQPAGTKGEQVEPTAERQRETSTRTSENVNWESERNEWIRSEIMPLLDTKAPIVKHEGKAQWRHCPNPHHPDEHPSFRISYDRDSDVGIPQCSCDIQNQNHPWDLVAGWVGAREFVVWWKEERKPQVQLKQPSDAPFSENTTIEAEPNEPHGLLGGGSSKAPAPTDDEIGDMVIGKWDDDYAYFYERWNRYDAGVWTIAENIGCEIWETMQEAKLLGYKPTSAKAKSIEDYLKAKLFVPNHCIDHEANYINLRNGVFDLRTFKLESHQREFYLTTQLGFDHDPEAVCPVWEAFLNTALTTISQESDLALIALLQEAFGYSLTTDTYFHKGFWLCGPTASGKSTALMTLKALLGNGYISVDLNILDKNAYQLADLPGKRVAGCAEAKVGAKLSDNLLKTLISGEEIAARPIYGNTIRFQPAAKLWWAMNDLPENPDRSDAIYRRLLIFPFPNSVPKEKQDLHLLDKLYTELPGIFNWAIQGLVRLHQNHAFTEVDQVQAAIEAYKAESDTEANFLNDAEWCVPDAEAQTQANDLYIAYKAWCERFGHRAKSSTKVAKDWERLGLIKEKNGVIWYTGVVLTDPAKSLVTLVNHEQINPRRHH